MPHSGRKKAQIQPLTHTPVLHPINFYAEVLYMYLSLNGLNLYGLNCECLYFGFADLQHSI